MKTIVSIALTTVSLFAVLVTPPAAQADDGYWFLEFKGTTAPASALTVGVDERDGRGFGFVTYLDDNADGIIQVPRIPVGSRLALGVSHTSNSKIPGCDIWDLAGPDVIGTTIEFPLLIVAEDIEGESLGIDYGQLMAPPITLTPGERFTITNGRLAVWPDIRLVDESNVPDLETFVQVVDTLPDFNGDVVVSDATVRFTFVPEPSAATLLVLGGLFWACRASVERRER